MSRLRKEFEPRRANLLARGCIPISEVLSKLHAGDTRLRGAGLLEIPSVLTAQAPATPSVAPLVSRSNSPPLPPTSCGVEGRPRTRSHCGYCDKDGHPESNCFKKQHHMRNMEHNSSPSTSSTVTFTEQDIFKLKRLLAASGSPSTGSAGLVSNSTIERPPSSQSGEQHRSSGWSWPSPP